MANVQIYTYFFTYFVNIHFLHKLGEIYFVNALNIKIIERIMSHVKYRFKVNTDKYGLKYVDVRMWN